MIVKRGNIGIYICMAAIHLLLLSAGIRAQTPSAPSAAAVAASPPEFVTLRGNTHPLAQPQNDAGAAPESLALERMLLVLQRNPQKEAELRRFLEAQQTSGSPSYHQWLTPQEFGRRFGLADPEMEAVTSWLSANGLHVDRVAAGRTIVEFSGTAGQVRRALGTEIHKFVVSGGAHWANAGDPQVPAALAPIVSGIVSLNNFPRKPLLRARGTVSRSQATGQLTPQFTFPADGCTSTGNCYAVGPQDFAVIYDVAPLWAAGIDGSGQTIAIASESNIRLKDTQAFRSVFGLPPNDPVVILDGPDPGVSTPDETEANFDVQWSGAVAKKATIDLVVAQSTATTRGVDLAAIFIVDNNLAPILVDTFGECEAALGAGGNSFYMFLWEQAAVQGITVVAAAGDTGSAGCDNSRTELAATQGHAVNGLASTPFNVAVGGTDFDQSGNWATYWNSTNTPMTMASAKSYIPEVTWNDTCAENGLNGCAMVSPSGSDLVAGGGGPSTYYVQPAWQTGSGVPPNGVRNLPDVALFASDGNIGSFFVICQSDALANTVLSCDPSAPAMNFPVIGGTSGAAACFAGVMALVNQKTASRQGNANFVLYPLAAKVPAAFHDITKGGSSVACVAGTPDCSNTGKTGYGVLAINGQEEWSAFPGYDLVTGLGSVDANVLVQNWSLVSFQPTTTTLTNLSPTSLTHGQSVSFQVQVTSPGGTPTGDVAILAVPSAGPPIGADFFTLKNGTISASTTFLPGGAYNVIAHYAGDGFFGASDSAPVKVTVGAEASQTVISTVVKGVCQPSPSSVPYGSAYAVRFDVNLSGVACSGVPNTNSPTGTVMVLNGDIGTFGAGTYLLNSRGNAADTSALTPAGNYSLVATYSGDAGYGPSTSNSYTLQITPARTTISLRSSESTVAAGTSVTLTATVKTQSIAAAPFGKVTFTVSGSGPIGSADVVPVPSTGPDVFVQGTATLTYAPTTTVTITAAYSGNANYFPSPPAQVTLTSGAPDFAPAAPASPIVISAAQPGSGVITVAQLFGFTGTVSISCPASLPHGLSCAVSPSTLTVGTAAATATVTISNTVAAPAMAASLTRQNAGESASLLDLTVAGFACFPMVLLVWSRKGFRYGLLLMAMGTALGLASCGGQSSNSSPATFTLLSTAPKAPADNPVTLVGVVSASHPVGGTVSFSQAGASLGAPVPVMVGRAFLTTNPLPIGFYSFTATYSGDATTPSGASGPILQTMVGTDSLQMQLASGNLSHSLTLPIRVQ